MNKNNINFCAILLCGGLGRRLSLITDKIPKPMIKVFNKPLIWFSLNALIKSNVSKIILPLGYKGNIIENYIKKKFQKNLNKIIFVKTGEKTNITKRIKLVKKEIKNYKSFLLVNSDTIFNYNLNKLIYAHSKSLNKITVSSSVMKTTWGTFEINKKKNVIMFSKNNYIKSYKLKNSDSIGFRNSGITAIDTDCINFLSDNEKDFEIRLINRYIKKKQVGLYMFDSLIWEPVENQSDLDYVKKNVKIKNFIKNSYE